MAAHFDHERSATVGAVEQAELLQRLGERVRELRKARGLSRVKLGRLIGGSAEIVTRIEQGRNLNSAFLAPLAEALRVEPRDLFDWPGPARPMRPGAATIVALVEQAELEEPGFAVRAARILTALRSK